MKVLFVTSEMYPYAKAGGLGDVSFSLPRALKRLGVDIISAVPLYNFIDPKKHGIRHTGKWIDVYVNGGWYKFEILRKNNIFFFKNEELLKGSHVYGPAGWEYENSDIRFGSFCWAVAESLRSGLIEADIIHLNDWPTALIAVILKEIFGWDKKVILTIHNIAYQGIFDKEAIDRLALPSYLFNTDALEFWGRVNLLKGGIIYSDFITTVSSTYAEEILTQEYGYGLEGVLKRYRHKLRGILNGIDNEVWNPKKDPKIFENFSARDIDKKEKNKNILLKRFNINPADSPLLAFINRLTHQKGVELILESVEELSRLNAFFFFLGEGEYSNAFREIGNIYENIITKVSFDDALARQLYSSADFIMMPSFFEPCGLSHLIGMRYGCIPLVRETGGLADTVVDISEDKGYGITFKNPTKWEFMCAVKRAVELYHNKERLKKIRREVLKKDFSWKRFAREYLDLYNESYKTL